MSDGGNVEWARSLRAQLASDIQLLGARAREGGARPEELGLLPDRDRLAALQRRLEQVDRLIEALELTVVQDDDAWPENFGDPTHPPPDRAPPGRGGHRHKPHRS